MSKGSPDMTSERDALAALVKDAMALERATSAGNAFGAESYSWLATNLIAAGVRLAPEGELDAAWAKAEAALPEGADLMVGHTTECRFCAGWWATSSKRLTEPPYYAQIVSSEDGRPRGEHHDATPAAALLALADRLTGTTDP